MSVDPQWVLLEFLIFSLICIDTFWDVQDMDPVSHTVSLHITWFIVEHLFSVVLKMYCGRHMCIFIKELSGYRQVPTNITINWQLDQGPHNSSYLLLPKQEANKGTLNHHGHHLQVTEILTFLIAFQTSKITPETSSESLIPLTVPENPNLRPRSYCHWSN